MKNMVRVVVGLVLLAGLGWAVWPRSTVDPSDLATIAAEFNKRAPKETAGVRLDRATVQASDRLRIHFTVMKGTAKDYPPGTMSADAAKLIESFCNGPLTSDMLADGNSIEMSYQDLSGAPIEIVTIGPAECGH